MCFNIAFLASLSLNKHTAYTVIAFFHISPAGREDQTDSCPQAGVPRSLHGTHHSGVLSGVLDPLWDCGYDGHIWTAWPHHTHC